MAEPMDTADSKERTKELLPEVQMVRMSLRPPSRYSGGTDLVLWLKRFEMYVRKAQVDVSQWTGELLPLLDDGPFRVVSQQGLVDSDDYEAVTMCLRAQYAPEGNHLEWQAKFHRRGQKADENLVTYVGELRALADKAYPGWTNEQRLQLVRDQFVQGVCSSTVQLRLMKEMPNTLDEALQLAIQQESVETAQRRLSKECGHGSSVASSGVEELAAGSGLAALSVQQLRKQAQDSERMVEDLRKQVEELNRRLSGKGKTTAADQQRQSFTRKQGSAVITCWNCGERGHVRRNCPRKRKDHKDSWQAAAVSSTLMVEGSIEGRVTRMLVDTGSAVMLVREDVISMVPSGKSLTTQVPANSVVAANGEKLDIIGQCNLSIKVGVSAKDHPVLIAKNLNQECLLGADFLIKHGCIVDLQQQILLTKEGPVQFLSPMRSGVQSSPVCFVTLSETINVPPYCQMCLPAKVSRHAGHCTSSSGALLVEPVGRFMDQHGLLVAYSIMDAAASHTMVQVLNPGFAPITVHKDEIMGMLKPIDDSADCASVQYPACKQSTQSVKHCIEQMTDGLAPEVREKVTALLWQFQDVIASDDSDLGRTRLTSHKINTGDTQPVCQHARRLPFHQQQEVRGLLDDMLSRGIIEPSCGPWASPIVLVRKKDGTTRFCVDFRRLNDCTRKDAQPLPRIDDTLDALGGARYFSTLDLASGYWQVEVDSKDREKTAFVTPFGLFQFRVMPFGLCNAPATFQRLMERVLAGLHWVTCLVYLDDIIIFSRTVEKHIEQLKEVLERLKGAGLKVRPSKCHLLQTSVQYLGHVISGEGIRTDPQKVACVSNWPVPQNSKELQSFLGLSSYYRRFVKDFAHVASPLHALTQKGRKWMWTKECNDAFFDLKKRLVSSPILALPDFSLHFVLDTDASGDGLGAVLAQSVDGEERMVAYASRALSRTEKKYCATRRVLLALVWAAQHFRPYLYGRNFTLRTDHHCLQWLHNFKEPEGQVARWLELLAEYDYSVLHRQGKQHTNADALSRGG